MNRKTRRALASITKRLRRAIPRAVRTFHSPLGEQARIHVADLWKAYARVTGDVSVL